MPLRAPAAVPVDIRDWSRWAREALTGLVESFELANEVITTEKVAGGPDADDDRFYVKRDGALTFDMIADADLPTSIARDSEVTVAASAAQAAAEATAADALAAHEGAANPHPVYLTQTEGDARYVQLTAAWTTVLKSADETITSDNTLDDDAILKFAMAANTKYTFRARIFFDTTAAADFKYRHAGPASPTLVRVHRREVIAGGTADTTSTVDVAYSAADISLAGAGTTGGYIELDGTIHNGANAGDFTFQWAQNMSDASNTTVRAGSYVEWI